MALIQLRKPWTRQPNSIARLSERFSWPGSIAYTPTIGAIGAPYVKSDGIYYSGTTAGLGAKATGSADNIDLGKVTRLGLGGATWVMTLRRSGTAIRYPFGTLDNGTAYIEQYMVNALASESVSAGNISFYYRTSAGARRCAGTTNAPLQLGRVHTIVFQITSGTTWALYIDGVEQTVSYDGTGTITGASGLTDYPLLLCNRSLRATINNGTTDVDVIAFGRFPSNDIDIASLSANPWQMFSGRRILIPVAAAGGAPTITALSARLITTTSAQPRISYS